MAKTALTLLPRARTPERQRLADAIMERDRRAALVEAKRAEIKVQERQRDPLYTRRAELEEELQQFGSGAVSEVARRDALLRGETLPDDNKAEAARAELADVTDGIVRGRKAEAELATDIQLLETPCVLSRLDVERAIDAVLAADPARAAILDELKHLQPRVTQLRRAANGAFRAADAEYSHSPSDAVRDPCPWEVAKARLATDPDARLPMPDDVFAEPPPRSAA